MGKTFAEKALGRAVGRDVVEGDIVTAYPDFCMSHENTSSICNTFRGIGVDKVYDPDRIVVVFDHTVPPSTEGYANSQKVARKFVEEQGIRNFFDMNRQGGICHQIMCQEGFAAPGFVTVGADSHTCTHGAMGAFSAGIGRSEMAAVWATGKLWLRVPQSMKITVEGEFASGVTAKDLILAIIGDVGGAGADYLSIEYHGDAIERMTVGERMTLCNMGVEMGAKNSVCRPDEKVFRIVREKARKDGWEPVWADADARYVKELRYRLEELEPVVALPGRVDNRAPLASVLGKPIDQAFVGTCTNGRIEDLRIVAKILKGKTVAVRTLIQPASVAVYRQALAEGVIDDLLAAGCVVSHPGCGPCIGVYGGVLADGEVCLSTANRNFTGRMGSRSAEIILASPASVASAALEGVIADPRNHFQQ